jgi:hypothetical protein
MIQQAFVCGTSTTRAHTILIIHMVLLVLCSFLCARDTGGGKFCNNASAAASQRAAIQLKLCSSGFAKNLGCEIPLRRMSFAFRITRSGDNFPVAFFIQHRVSHLQATSLAVFDLPRARQKLNDNVLQYMKSVACHFFFKFSALIPQSCCYIARSTTERRQKSQSKRAKACRGVYPAKAYLCHRSPIEPYY